MVPIISPKPRSAPAQLPNRPAPRGPSPPCDPADDPFYFVPDPRSLKSPPRLLSPFRLPEEAGRPKPAPCSPTKRRRGVSSNLSRSGRRRHTARSECCINTFPRPITSLDELPWISALTIQPDFTDPWDIADLSLLNADWQAMSEGPGPVRRRKMSLRSDPLSQSSPKRAESPTPVSFPFASTDGAPQTPYPRSFADPSEVVFHALHPIFPSDVAYPPNRTDNEMSP
ncbi:hypothetical protein BV20DRAFT_403650 [Pilatotrama ljubarskyi]|nr:hypothetical protein BV20DRAFT_403650 [Pilatotrama ljubarskyi]